MNKINLVIVPFHDYRKCKAQGFRTRDGHLMQHFMKNKNIEKILIIDRPLSYLESLYKKTKFQPVKNESVKINNNTYISQVSKNTFVVDQLVHDYTVIIRRKKWWHDVYQKEYFLNNLKESIKYLNMKNYVLYLWNPLAAKLINKLDEQLVVFDAIDNWTIHPQMKSVWSESKKGYENIKKNADVIFTNSYKLKEFLGSNNKMPICIKNGVDIENFRNNNYIQPDDLKNISSPIIGYIGKIQERIDYKLINYLTAQLPQYKFVMIGQIIDKKWFEKIKKRDNFLYLGDKNYKLVPNYVKKFDVCIIPHNVEKYEVDGDAIKLYEYLAAQKPVVTTMIAGVDEFSNVVHIAKSHDEFKNAIVSILSNKESEIKYELDKKHTWSYKADEMIEQISNNLK